MREQNKKNDRRNGALDFLKFVFATIIVCFHAKNLTPDKKLIFVGGSLGVEFFFIISGIFFAGAVERKRRQIAKHSNGSQDIPFGKACKEGVTYLFHRIKGLCPNYYVAFVIAFLVEHFGKYSWHVWLKDFMGSISELLFISETGMKSYSVNDVTWYLGIMILVMFILYPIVLTQGERWYCYLGPILFVFLYGITYQKYNTLVKPHEWNGIVYKGFMRAVMDISFGTIIYKLETLLRFKDRLKSSIRILLTVIEMGMYGTVLFYMWEKSDLLNDWEIVLILGIGIFLTYSKVTFLPLFFRSNLFHWLGEFSFSLYLSHGFWSHKMNYLFPGREIKELFIAYLLISFGTGFFVFVFSIILKKLWNSKKQRFSQFFLLEQ